MNVVLREMVPGALLVQVLPPLAATAMLTPIVVAFVEFAVGSFVAVVQIVLLAVVALFVVVRVVVVKCLAADIEPISTYCCYWS